MTPEEALVLFKSECQLWIDLLELNNFYWEFDVGYLPDAHAEYHFNVAGSSINVMLSEEIVGMPNYVDLICYTAKHEVIEAGLLGYIKILAEERIGDFLTVSKEVHSIVNKLVKLLEGNEEVE